MPLNMFVFDCSCCCCCKSCCSKKVDPSDPVVSDNCCECNLAALRKIGGLKNTDLIYVTYHVDVSRTTPDRRQSRMISHFPKNR